MEVKSRVKGSCSLGQLVLGLVIFLLFSLFFGDYFGSLLVQLHELGEIELGLLNHLDFSDEDILDREDLATLLLNLLSDSLLNAK